MKAKDLLKYFTKDRDVKMRVDGFELYTLRDGYRVVAEGIEVFAVEVREDKTFVFVDRETNEWFTAKSNGELSGVEVYEMKRIV